MRLTMRPWEGDEDTWRIRELLRRAMLANGRRERSWHVARWDYWWWFGNPDLEHLAPEAHVFLWEADDGVLAGVLNPEQAGNVFLQADPAFAGGSLDESMLAEAEERLSVGRDGGRRWLQVYVDADDQARRDLLARRGYRRVDGSETAETQHRRALDEPMPDVPVVAGYTIRPQRDGLELLERCYASGLGFHDDVQVARANRDDPAWYHHIQAAPLYRRDLDIVAVADDGAIAAFCTAWFDDATRTAYLEPVATVAAHRRRGLARGVILEALHRLRRMGCLVAFVGGYSEEANALYASVMGPDHDVSEPWELVR